jgi:hypothetical protein
MGFKYDLLKGIGHFSLTATMLGVLCISSLASQVLNRNDLQATLGSGRSLDTFEAADLPPNTQIGLGENLTAQTVLSNSATNVVSLDSEYQCDQNLFLQNLLGNGSTNLDATSATIRILPKGLTVAIGLDVATYSFVTGSVGIVRFYRFGVELGSIPWSFAGTEPHFIGWEDPLGIDEVRVERLANSYAVIDNVEFKVQRPLGREFYSLDLVANNLVRLNPITGAVTVIGSLGVSGIVDADLTWHDGWLYAAVVNDVRPPGHVGVCSLLRIDPASGAVVARHELAPVGNYLDYVEGIASAGGKLVISTANQSPFGSHSSDALWEVDPISGMLTNLHSYVGADINADLDALEGLPNGDLLVLDNEPGSYKRYIRAGSGPYFYTVLNVTFNHRASINDWVLDGSLLIGPNDYTDSVVTLDTTTGNVLYSVWIGSGNYRGAALPPSNQPPIAVDDFYGLAQGSALGVAPSGILVNDSDPDEDDLTVELVSSPAHATSFQLNADGSFSYVPAPYFYGEDSFTYRAFDGTAYSEVATVHITVSQPGAQGFITGGGKFFQDGRKCTFGFVAKVLGSGVQGNLEFQDHDAGIDVKSSSVEWVYAPNQIDGYFSGTCKVNGVSGYTYFVQVHDRGEPGRNDDISVWIFDPFAIPTYTSSGLLSGGGNIVIHR